jgi:hypothetical protein
LGFAGVNAADGLLGLMWGRERPVIDVVTTTIGRNVVSVVLSVPFVNFERWVSHDDALKRRIAGVPPAPPAL